MKLDETKRQKIIHPTPQYSFCEGNPSFPLQFPVFSPKEFPPEASRNDFAYVHKKMPLPWTSPKENSPISKFLNLYHKEAE